MPIACQPAGSGHVGRKNVTRTGVRKYPPIPVNAPAVRCSLTFQQERVLYFCELNPDSSIWDINTCKRLTGDLDPLRLECAVDRLIQLHQVLRTRISRGSDGPTQSFDQDTRRAFRRIDLSQERDIERALQSQISEICKKPISKWTYEEPLFEVVLIALGARDNVLLFRVHHIISDAASVDLLWRDLRLIYNELARGGPGFLPPKAIQYSDYAIWQRSQFGAEQTREQEEYWLSQFHDEPPALDLPTDSAPSPAFSFNGGLAIVDIPRGLIDEFQRLSWERRVLLFSSLLSAFYVMLQKFCQQEDITVGVLFSGRHYCPALLEITGYFVNMTAVRVNVGWEYTFSQLVNQVHEQVEAAYYMQDYPFERLVEKVAPTRGDARVPLVRTMFNLVPNMDDESKFEGLEQERWIEVATQTTAVQVDLIFDLHWGAKGAEIRIEHNTDIFRTSTVVRLAKYYTTLLSQLSAGWDVGLKELGLVDEEETRQLIEGWNQTSAQYPCHKCVHELFEQQACETPDEIAIVDGELALTYDEANQRANRLARALRDRGVGPDSIVAIVGTRSAGMVLGQLGILKAGGGYLPIAASSPRRRIREILRDAGPRALIVPDDFGEDVEFEGPVIRSSDPEVSEASAHNLVNQTGASHLAYVIYTSGSTGAPKGVMVEHRSVVNLATNLGYLDMRAGDRILQTGAPSFDATTFEIWGALLNGLTLYIADDEVLLDGRALGRFLAENGIGILFLIPPLLNQMAEADASLFRPLKALVTGGDVLSVKHVERIRKANPSLLLVNAYGPTENTTFSTYYPITETPHRTVPIGRPVPNSKAYVFDREMMLSPTGAIGELYVAGDGIARGYLNRPALTEERFIPNPVVPGERFYRTGDLVRRRADGIIEFMGRADRQVKVRGFRIELGEIENRLLEHRSVKEAAIVPATGEDGSKHLCAYYVAEGKVAVSELRKHVADSLPGYMLPSYFCQVERMPLTENGKIDQRALPEPHREAGEEGEHAALRTEEEAAVARIWEELLGTSTIGAHDNFFEVGGHSLKAGALASRLTAEFGIEVSLRTVFDSPTVAELAAVVANGRKECHDAVAH
jgi:tyrocidine synthetase-3